MVAAFQALGTLMALGLMLLPAVASSFWAREVWSMTAIAAPMALLSAAIGLLISFHAGLPSGPVIVLMAMWIGFAIDIASAQSTYDAAIDNMTI